MLVLGDAHANDPERRRSLFAAYRSSDEDVALQAGDLFYYDLPVDTHFVAGNNENFDVIDALRHGRLRSEGVRNAHLLASEVVDVEGVRVGGLSGNYAPTQYEKPREALYEDRRRHFVEADVEGAKSLSDVDVFLAHEAPHGTPVSEDYDVGCVHVDEILEALEPSLCIVGHHHQHTESTFGDTRVVTVDPVWESYYELDPETLALRRFETPPA
ncbi:MAG: metallophosphoesterase [Halanaeroarchaeum sp.]